MESQAISRVCYQMQMLTPLNNHLYSRLQIKPDAALSGTVEGVAPPVQLSLLSSFHRFPVSHCGRLSYSAEVNPHKDPLIYS